MFFRWLQNICLSARRVFDYRGCATRAEYWGFVLFVAIWWGLLWWGLLWGVAVSLLCELCPVRVDVLMPIISVCNYLIWFVWTALSVRRLRDAGFSPLWGVLPLLLNFAGLVITCYFPGDLSEIVINGSDSPSSIHVLYSELAALCYILCGLSIILIGILCIRKSRSLSSRDCVI